MHVSVIMAIYNGAPLIERAINNLYEQTLKEWDLIIVDDGSTDNSAEIIRDIAKNDPRITFLKNEGNRGLAYSLNRAWKEAKGELIARCDVDDENLPTRFEKQVVYLYEHPEVDVLGTAAYFLDPHGNSLGVSVRPEEHKELVNRMYKETPFFHPSIMARRTFFEQSNGYRDDIKFGQDSELWLRTYKTAVFHNLEEPLIRYTTKQGLPFTRVYWAIRIIVGSAYRDGKLFSKGWYALRYAIAAILVWFKIKKSGARLRPSA